MFSKLTKVTASTARQVVRANQQFNHGRWIATTSGNNRSDVLTQNQSNDKVKLEQQERWRMRRTERFVCLIFVFLRDFWGFFFVWERYFYWRTSFSFDDDNNLTVPELESIWMESPAQYLFVIVTDTDNHNIKFKHGTNVCGTYYMMCMSRSCDYLLCVVNMCRHEWWFINRHYVIVLYDFFLCSTTTTYT